MLHNLFATKSIKVDRKGRSRSPETGFSTIPGRFWEGFSSFFEVASRDRRESQREGPSLCFCYQAQYFRGFADFAEKRKTDENRRKIGPTTLHERAERKKLDFFACGHDSASILVASALSGAFPGAS